jgi:hypothetical protein
MDMPTPSAETTVTILPMAGHMYYCARGFANYFGVIREKAE